ncbi:uncharacterized protein LOC103512239 [Diaphorina citri]|uniref:Uncharacterized protein LOC103512239 n=1 Tax=Diaphorina citri TaxID=121845 RepID=A0A3Q0IZD7_DIACI|nr:uncharacterized protein LOC103512239 [Diaphorina citri]
MSDIQRQRPHESNVAECTKEGAFITDHFQRSPPMSVGSLALFMHDFQVPPVNYENVGIKSSVWGRHDFYLSLSKAHSLLPSVLIALELYMSRPFPLPELNLVALPNFSEDEPIDSWGLMMFKESELMNGDSFWLTYKLAKYASSQWINHLTTPDTNATIFYQALQHFLGDKTFLPLRASTHLHFWLMPVLQMQNHTLYEHDLVYKEFSVQLILHMLEHVLGTQSFKAGFQTFLVRRYPPDIGRLLLGFGGVTTVVVHRVGIDTLQILQLILHMLEHVLGTQSFKAGFQTFLVRRLLNMTLINETSSKHFTEEDKFPASPFIVNYDLQNWYFLSQKATTLPEAIRIQVLHDALSLALIGRLNYTVALNMTHLLRKEQEPTVWRTFYPLAEQMRKQFIGTELARPFDAYIRTLIQPVFDALGAASPDESALKSDFRAKTKHILCAAGHEPCINEARTMFQQWTKNSAPDFGMPIASSYLCTVFAWGSVEEWNFALDRFINFPSENRTQSEKVFLLRTLSGCPQDAIKLEK